MSNTKKRLHFAGEHARGQVIERPWQLLTIRAKKKGFVSGEDIEASFDNDPSGELKVVSEKEQVVKEIHPGLLLLDGFLNPHAVVEMLAQYYSSYGSWSPDSTVARTLFVPAWIAESNGPSNNMKLFYGSQYYRKDDFEVNLIKDGAFNNLFYYAFYYWLVEHHGFKMDQYPGELQARDLASDNQVKGMLELLQMARKTSRGKSKRSQEKAKHFTHHFIMGDTPDDIGER